MKKGVLILFVISLGLYGCGPYSKSAVKVGAPGTKAPAMPHAYRIAPGDKLSVKLFYNPDLNQDVRVQPDGTISLMLVNEVKAAGLTTEELRKTLTKDYGKYLQQPNLTVVVIQSAGNRIFVGGEVRKPSMELLTGPTTVLDAIDMAGGFSPTARTDDVIVLRRGANNKPFEIALNTQKAMKGADLSQNIYLQPYDMVIVPRSHIANVDQWVQQYIGSTIGVFGNAFLFYYYMNPGGIP
ncbi:MAG: polysaccharide export protein [Deltaproteobacteria bacterium]|jgi:protein involved in polysaccharide export with SLBB domain|nr:polysaccharide export protein [Deltaproteobacteria bacterium]